MHAGAEHQGNTRLWLIAGTGEGPPLARAFLAGGWRVRVFVVGASAARAFPETPGLEIAVGALGDDAAIEAALEQAAQRGQAPRWVVDASHPFASRVSGALAAACERREQPLLRLLRPLLPAPGATVLANLEDLHQKNLEGAALLLAIGARQLSLAVACTPGAQHHARILPNPAALAAAMAAGLAPDRVAALRPGSGPGIERALCHRWGISAVLCRRSGSASEVLWHQLAAEQGLELLLLERPGEPGCVPALGLEELLARIGSP